MKLIRILTLGLAFLALPAMAADEITATEHVLVRTNLGEFVIALDAKQAPKTVENFLTYVDSGFYTNTIFHRVISGFMIQGGGYDSTFKRKDTRSAVINEAENGLTNRRARVAMARTFDPHSASSQFFINMVDNHFLDHRAPTPGDFGYAVFGEVVSGMEVVDQTAQLQTGPGGEFSKDVPLTLVIIEQMQRTQAPAPSSERLSPTSPTNKGK
ncbi:MAG: peptidylprolyl isomerase [Gammaproteobacteria bacterium]|nr:peptidylprolyl isomerase [Gammaproteobacteria bacterium]